MITNNVTKIGISLAIVSLLLFGLWYWQNSAIDNSKKEPIQQKVALETMQDDQCAMDAEVLRIENGVFECSVDANGNPIRWILQEYDD